MNRADVTIFHEASTTGGRAKARYSRRDSITSKKITATHRPTGLAVSGEIEPGHYSRKEMQALTAKLEAALLEKLERLVRKKTGA